MGFFRRLGSSFGKVVEKVGDGIGNATGWYWLGDVGRSIQDVFSSNISKESSYDKNVANVLTTERLNEMLVSFSEKYLHDCERLEEQCIEETERYCNALIQLIKESLELTKNPPNLKRIERNLLKIRTAITGSIKEPLAKCMSLDDSECLRILKMDSGKKKEEEMKRFCKRIINEALDNLGIKVRKAIREQTEEIEDFLKNYAELQEKEITVAKGRYEAMLREDMLKEDNIEKSSMMPRIILKTAEVAETLL